MLEKGTELLIGAASNAAKPQLSPSPGMDSERIASGSGRGRRQAQACSGIAMTSNMVSKNTLESSPVDEGLLTILRAQLDRCGPERLHAARCRPNGSRMAPQPSHAASVMVNGRRKRSRNSARKSAASISNSGARPFATPPFSRAC